METSDVVEPPKQITARHVAAVFEKMGFDPAAGTKVGYVCVLEMPG
jgi:hypothetical protein